MNLAELDQYIEDWKAYATSHQAHPADRGPREASAEGSDNLSKAYAKSLATEKAMRDRFPDYQSRYQLRYS